MAGGAKAADAASAGPLTAGTRRTCGGTAATRTPAGGVGRRPGETAVDAAGLAPRTAASAERSSAAGPGRGEEASAVAAGPASALAGCGAVARAPPVSPLISAPVRTASETLGSPWPHCWQKVYPAGVLVPQ